MKKRLGVFFAGVLVAIVAGCSAPADAGGSAAVAPSSDDESTSSTVVPEGQLSISVPEAEGELEIVIPQAAPLLHTWTNAVVVDVALEVPSSDLERCQHLHLDLCDAQVSCAEVVCWLTDEYFLVAPAVCPACEEERIACDGEVLRCSACRAEFDLVTGVAGTGGSAGLNVSAVPFELTDGALRVVRADITDSISNMLSLGEAVKTAENDTAEQEAESIEEEKEEERGRPPCC